MMDARKVQGWGIDREVIRLGLGGGSSPRRRRSPVNWDWNLNFLHCCFGHHATVDCWIQAWQTIELVSCGNGLLWLSMLGV